MNMKIITILILFINLSAHSQIEVDKFHVTHEGFEKQYVVLNFENKTSSHIFHSLKKWAEYNIRNSDYSNYSEIENEYLAYTFTDVDAIDFGRGLTRYVHDIIYDIEFRIKEWRLRVDLKIIRLPMTSFSNGLDLKLLGGTHTIFKRNGGIRAPKKLWSDAITDIDRSAEKMLRSFKNAVLNSADYKKKDW